MDAEACKKQGGKWNPKKKVCIGYVNKGNLVNYIMDHETGEASASNDLELFSYLIKTGQCWSLQGHYGRTASNLIKLGYIDKSGTILKRK